MARRGMTVKIKVHGLEPILRAFDKLPENAKELLIDESNKLASKLVIKMKLRAARLGRQDALAARTLKVEKLGFPKISAGLSGSAKARGVVFGSEFGASGRFGWYAKERYVNSPRRQFRAHLGANSYWFFKTVEENEVEIGLAYADVAGEVVRRWGSGPA